MWEEAHRTALGGKKETRAHVTFSLSSNYTYVKLMYMEWKGNRGKQAITS